VNLITVHFMYVWKCHNFYNELQRRLRLLLLSKIWIKHQILCGIWDLPFWKELESMRQADSPPFLFLLLCLRNVSCISFPGKSYMPSESPSQESFSCASLQHVLKSSVFKLYVAMWHIHVCLTLIFRLPSLSQFHLL
jgi:hypothetical protein